MLTRSYHPKEHFNKSINWQGCVVKVPQCLGSISLVWHKLRAEKFNKTSITAIWMDAANAYGPMGEGAYYLPVDKKRGFSFQYFEILGKYGREMVFPTLEGTGNHRKK